MDNAAVLKSCVQYFKEKPIYKKLFRKLREKYAGLGHMGGSFSLGDLPGEERDQLSGFLQRDLHKIKRVTITMHMLETALAKSRFSVLTWEEILEAYDEKPLLVNRDVKALQTKEKELFFAELYELCEGEPTVLQWMRGIVEEGGAGYQTLMQQYKKDPARLKVDLLTFKKCVALLPYREDRTELIPVFAAKSTGNPHYYDEGTFAYGLLMLYLKFLFPTVKLAGLSGAEKKNRILFAAGLVKDEISNYSVAYGVCGRQKSGNMHSGIEGFYKAKEPVHLSLWTLGTLESLWANNGQKIYVLENPAVFAQLIKQNPHVTAVCSNGQPRLATLLLLDFLVEQGSLYYAGDFDPEGLLIAQRLKERYGEKLILWKYHVHYYKTYLSDVKLNKKRIKKLQHVVEPELMAIREVMEVMGRATYQEAMIEVYGSSI